MSADRTGFFKTLAKSIHSQRQALAAQQQARDATAEELLALRRLKKCEELTPNGVEHMRCTEAEILDAQCAYHCVQDIVSPVGTLSVPVQC